MQVARETPGDYGRRFQSAVMAFEIVEARETEDHYIVTLSFRPEGGFQGRPGREQFFVTKDGTVAHRQVLSLPGSRVTARLTVAGAVVVALAIGAVIAAFILSNRSTAGSGVANQTDPMPTPVAAGVPVSTPTPLPTPTIIEVVKEVPVEVIRTVVVEKSKEITVPATVEVVGSTPVEKPVEAANEIIVVVTPTPVLGSTNKTQIPVPVSSGSPTVNPTPSVTPITITSTPVPQRQVQFSVKTLPTALPTPSPILSSPITEIPDEWYLKVLPEDENTRPEVTNVPGNALYWPVDAGDGVVLLMLSNDSQDYQLARFDVPTRSVTVDASFGDVLKATVADEWSDEDSFRPGPLRKIGNAVGLILPSPQGNCYLVTSEDRGRTWASEIMPSEDAFGYAERQRSRCTRRFFLSNGEIVALTTGRDDKEAYVSRDLTLLRGQLGLTSVSDEIPVRDTSVGFVVGGAELSVSASGNIFAVWGDTRRWGDDVRVWDLYFAKSTDGGRTFGKNYRLSTESFSFGDRVGQRQLAASPINIQTDDTGTKVLITVSSTRETCDSPASAIVYLSQDGGTTFTEFQGPAAPLVPPEVGRLRSPLVLTYSNDPSIGWDESGKLHRLFNASSLLWTDQRVQAANGGMVYLCRNYLYYTHSTDEKLLSFEKPRRLYFDQGARSQPYGLVLTDTGEIVIAWAEFRSSNDLSVYFSVLD